MIILKEICIQDFLSHKDTLIHLNDGDKILLDGVSGSGKSSILDALLWCLYGRGRVENRALVRRGAQEAFVSVMLYDGKKYYDIRRLTTIAGKHTVTVFEGEDPDILSEVGTGGIRDTEAYIVKLLGASYQLFVNSVVFPQDGTESFVTATGVRRKELLLEILKTGDVTEYYEKTRDLISEKVSSVASLSGKLEASVLLMEGYDSKIVGLPHLLVREGVLEDEAKKAKVELVLAEQAQANIDSIYSTIKDDEKHLAMIKKAMKNFVDIPNPDVLMKECKEVLKDEDSVRESLRSAIKHNGEFSALISDRPIMRNYEAEIDSLNLHIKQIVDGVLPCPAGDNCPYSKTAGPELISLKREVSQRVKEREQQEIELKNWEKKIEALGPRIDTTELEAKLEKIGKAYTQLRDLQQFEEQTNARTEIERLEAVLKSAPTAGDVAEAANKVIQAMGASGMAERSLAEVRGEIKYLETLGGEIKRLEKECDETDKTILKIKEEVELLSDLREALGTTGITAVALDYLLPSLEDKVNEILAMLSDFRVELSTQKAGAAGGNIEGLFITVKNVQGESMDLNSYSGGERVRISVSISEALASLQKCGFRIMDETIVALDENMIENFTTVLGKIQSRYSQTICISHLQPVKDLFEKKLLITKLDGISQVV